MKKIFVSVIGIALGFISVSGQTVQQTQNKADQVLRSNGRVNPSTLALELSIPLAGYAGRAGNGKPVTLEYSSKVWDSELPYTWAGSYTHAIYTDLSPRFAKQRPGVGGIVTEGSHSGWTSSLGPPRIEFPWYDNYWDVPQGETTGGEQGQLWKEPTPLAGGEPGPIDYALYYVKRLNVIMPDGSVVGFRQDDSLYVSGSTLGGYGNFNWNGTYLSIDGSKLRLTVGSPQPILYMPDGGRYLFGGANHTATLYIDAHGNKTTYNTTTRQWTDTLGRLLTNPFPVGPDEMAPTEGEDTFVYPGMGAQDQEVEFVWEKLDTQHSDLAYTAAQHSCIPNISTSIPSGATSLFGGIGGYHMRVCGQSTPFNPAVLTEIRLANGSSYKFYYNLYGEIDRIDYPTGGYERFLYGLIKPLTSFEDSSSPYDRFNRGVRKRWVSSDGTAGTEVLREYDVETVTTGNPTTDYYRIVTTAPDGTSTEQYLHNESSEISYPWGFGNIAVGRPYDERSYASGTGTLASRMMSRKLTKYALTSNTLTGGDGRSYEATRDLRPERTVSIVFEPGNSNALATMAETVYDTSGNSDPAYFSSLNPKQQKTYHYVVVNASTAASANITTAAGWFSATTPATVTEMDYLYDANYKARNINGLVTETRVEDASGNVKAKSQITYDGLSLLSEPTSTRWENPNTNYRGLVTKTRSWHDIANNLHIDTQAQYDLMGNLRYSWDGNGNISQVEYSSTYDHAYPTKTISPDPDGAGAITPLETTVIYDYNTGLPTSTTDANGQTTTMEYNDPLLRPTRVIAPNGHQTITEYGAGTSELTRFVKSRSQIDETNWKEAYSWFDGLGRGYKSQSVDSSGDVFTETLFDEFGRPWKTSNPYRTGETKLWTENFYDTAGRVFKVKTPDGAEVETAWGLATTGSQIGTVVTVTDQAEKQRRSITNALGQLTRVDEPNNSGQLGTIDVPNQPTNYAYDTLNNLTTVTQGVQSRTFAYNSLSRLLSATNPESGTISYGYDPNGNLTSKLDARNITTSYVYDALNRVIQRNYTNEPTGSETPDVSYFYDNLPNAKGKLTKVTNGFSTTDYLSFDILGRVIRSKQTTDDVVYGDDTHPMTYTYNLSGALIEQTYPSGRVVKNVLDNNGNLSIVQSKKTTNHGYWNYAENFTFSAAGAVTSLQLGNGRWESTQFNSRLQPTQIALGTIQNGTDKLKVDYSYGSNTNNGNILTQQITVPTVGSNPGFVATQTYSYDSLNRLTQATETVPGQSGWNQTFTYDRYGNRNFNETATTTLPKNCGTPPNQTVCPADVPIVNPSVNAANNRLNGYVFDTSGNTTTDAENRTFIYDAENKQVEVRDSLNNVVCQYIYDGDGKRVKKIVPNGETVVFIYDAAGKLVAEYANQISQTPKVSYLTNDHLGSPRINTDENGAVIARHDYHPFGEEIIGIGGRTTNLGYAADDVRKQFTGYERDRETNLDYAQTRMFGSSLGRFTSPDDFVNDTHTSDPQSWNLYVYVRNNPLRFIDPDGAIKKDCGANKDQICTEKRKGLEKGDILIGKNTYQSYGDPIKGKDGKTYLIVGQVNKVWLTADDGKTKIKATEAVGELKLIATDSLAANESNPDTAMANEKDLSTSSSLTSLTNVADCHGTSFADGKYWINDSEVKKLLKGDGYTMTANPQQGDIGIFGEYKRKEKDGKVTMEPKDVVHSVTVDTVKSGDVSSVISKGGITPRTTTSVSNAWNKPAQIYYWTKRNK